MNTEAKRAIEAILMVADQPVEANLLAQITEVPVAQIDEICAELSAEYEAAERGFVIARIAGGYRFQSHPELAPYVERFVLDGQSARMSSAALETLAIVAYKQPISRAQIASIRGVNADGVMRTLEARGYVREVGRDPGPGNAVMYGTTPSFLEKLGLNTIDELPPLGAFVPGADVVEQLERTLRVESTPVDELVGEAGGPVVAAETTGDAAPETFGDDIDDELADDDDLAAAAGEAVTNGWTGNGNGTYANGNGHAAHVADETTIDLSDSAHIDELDIDPADTDRAATEGGETEPTIDLSDAEAGEPQPGEL